MVKIKFILIFWKFENYFFHIQNNHGTKIYERPKTANNIIKKNPANEGNLNSNIYNENIDFTDAKNKGLNPSNSISDKKDFIKKILVSAMKMKIKLKEQLESLNHNEVFPENLILNSLKFS